ncbi:hypothetical protein DXG01_012383 [Tephrocybe rancida]|nr:hypothetical protein DXG01_012383 [Tephrocybe rancida]
MSPSLPPPLSQRLPPSTYPQQAQLPGHSPSSRKRALDTADDNFETSSSGSVKRSRRSHISSDVLPTPHMDAEEDTNGETSTPRLSPPFSESEFSLEPMPPLPPPAPAPPTLRQDRETEKPMTRRQQGAGAVEIARCGPCGKGWWEWEDRYSRGTVQLGCESGWRDGGRERRLGGGEERRVGSNWSGKGGC